MARMRLLPLLIYLVLCFLCNTSYATQHRHRRRALLYREDEAVKIPGLQDAGEHQQEINNLQAKLDAKPVLENPSILSLDSGRAHKKKGWRYQSYEDISAASEENDSSRSSLEQLKPSLYELLSSRFGDNLEQTVQFLYDLLSPRFGTNRAHSAVTTAIVTATATSTLYSTTTITHGAGPTVITAWTTFTETATTTTSSSTTDTTTSTSSSTETTTTTTLSPIIGLTLSSSSTSEPTPSTPTRYTFDPMSSSNVAVYYGQTNQTGNVPFATVCNDSSVDIIILAFVNELSIGSAGYPALNMGPNCWAANSAQLSAGASGLIDCVADGFADEVNRCQDTGKKVLLSIGGAAEYSETTIPSEEDAVRIADNIWNIFGAGGLDDETIMPIRPFGDVVFDGFDIDNEDASTLHWPTLISTLRTHVSQSSSITNKPYFLSSAPQCPRPDASIPLQSMLTTIDFIFIQFYNNPACQLSNPAGFLDSVQAWSQDLSPPSSSAPSGFVNTGNGISSPRLFIGAYAFRPATGTGAGWVDGDTLVDRVQEVKGLRLANLGGVMFWDGAWGVLSARRAVPGQRDWNGPVWEGGGAGGGMGAQGGGRSVMHLAKAVLA